MTAAPAKNPCGSCPYRRDVPAGIWDASEYEKLPAYDGQTFEQPPNVFLCHQQDGRVCAGWAGCHDMDESLALRIAAGTGRLSVEDAIATRDYVSPVDLWPSGAAAAEHGVSGIENPDEKARRIILRLIKREGHR